MSNRNDDREITGAGDLESIAIIGALAAGFFGVGLFLLWVFSLFA